MLKPMGVSVGVLWPLLFATLGQHCSNGHILPQELGTTVCLLQPASVRLTLTPILMETSPFLHLCIPGSIKHSEDDFTQTVSRILLGHNISNLTEIFDADPFFKDDPAVVKMSLEDLLGQRPSRTVPFSTSHSAVSPEVEELEKGLPRQTKPLPAVLFSLHEEILPTALKAALQSGQVSNQVEYWRVLQSDQHFGVLALSQEVIETARSKDLVSAKLGSVHRKRPPPVYHTPFVRKRRDFMIPDYMIHQPLPVEIINRPPYQFNVDEFAGNLVSYSTFVEALRGIFSDGKYHDTLIGRRDGGLTSVRLVSHESGQQLLAELIFRNTDLYVVGFIVDSTKAYFDKDIPKKNYSLSDGTQLRSENLNFPFNYNDLEKKGSFSRDTFSLNFADPSSLIRQLATYEPVGQEIPELARNLFRLAMTTSEAVRFRPMQQSIQQAFQYYSATSLSVNFLEYVDSPNPAKTYREFSLAWLIIQWDNLSSKMKKIYAFPEDFHEHRKTLTIHPSEIGQILALAKGSSVGPGNTVGSSVGQETLVAQPREILMLWARLLAELTSSA